MTDFKLVETTVAGSLNYPVLGGAWLSQFANFGGIITNVVPVSSWYTQVNNVVTYSIVANVTFAAAAPATGGTFDLTFLPVQSISDDSACGILQTPKYFGLYGAGQKFSDVNGVKIRFTVFNSIASLTETLTCQITGSYSI